MPDARSGDCNGRTQGGSNAEVVIADAFVKGLGRTSDHLFATDSHGLSRGKKSFATDEVRVSPCKSVAINESPCESVANKLSEAEESVRVSPCKSVAINESPCGSVTINESPCESVANKISEAEESVRVSPCKSVAINESPCESVTNKLSEAEESVRVSPCMSVAEIDYAQALEAMLKDAEQDPGADHEKHGRGGLNEYRRLGYVPYGIPRAGTRTVEYAYNDYCIAQVAKGLSREDIYEEYMQRSRNWRNLWRADYEWDDVKGYIMPRDENGAWLDSVPWGRSKVFKPRIPYTPVTKVAPWYIPWWDTFFYEALSAEYSLSIPHDVEGLIEACGGKEAFQRRLDLFFERGRYNVGNEPSFLTPCLYHWLGRPDLSTQRIHQIIAANYSDTPDGLPGNDDSGAMSSWLAFHMMGLYPNAGQDYYLLNIPLLYSYTLTLPNGKSLKVTKKQKSKKSLSSRLFTVSLNGRELKDARITHKELLQGGELVYLVAGSNDDGSAKRLAPDGMTEKSGKKQMTGAAIVPNTPYEVSFTLNRQFRTWPLSLRWMGDTLGVVCKKTLYLIPRSEVEEGGGFCWLTPQDDGTIYPDVRGTFLFVSKKAIQQLKEEGFFVYDGITWRLIHGAETDEVWRVRADIDGTEMTLAYDNRLRLYLVREMHNNPLGIDWKIRKR
ncbi:MAG: glycoside hydrolase family 92 protein [Prevotella sp.]|nr:glycoside hydrolase family 92 protein [Prevotella sp.]